jgi:hypothetical protein
MIRIRLLMLRKSWRQLSTVSPQGLSQFGGVHGSRTGATKMWRNKPLLRGDRDSVDKVIMYKYMYYCHVKAYDDNYRIVI